MASLKLDLNSFLAKNKMILWQLVKIFQSSVESTQNKKSELVKTWIRNVSVCVVSEKWVGGEQGRLQYY